MTLRGRSGPGGEVRRVARSTRDLTSGGTCLEDNMRLSLRNEGWHGPSFDGNAPFDCLVFDVEDATGGQVQIRVDTGLYWRVNASEPDPKREAFTERLTLLALERL